jgi:hypothetical protein
MQICDSSTSAHTGSSPGQQQQQPLAAAAGDSGPSQLAQEGVSSGGNGSSGPLPQLVRPNSCQPLDELRELVTQLHQEVDDKQLVIHEPLGQGAYGVVYRGEAAGGGAGWGRGLGGTLFWREENL